MCFMGSFVGPGESGRAWEKRGSEARRESMWPASASLTPTPGIVWKPFCLGKGWGPVHDWEASEASDVLALGPQLHCLLFLPSSS